MAEKLGYEQVVGNLSVDFEDHSVPNVAFGGALQSMFTLVHQMSAGQKLLGVAVGKFEDFEAVEEKWLQ